MTESIQTLLREIDCAREKNKKLNRHNSEKKDLELKVNQSASSVPKQKRQKTQEHLHERVGKNPIGIDGTQKKKTPVTAVNLPKSKGLSGTKEPKPILGLKVTSDSSKKTALASSTVLKKNLESPISKKATEKESAASLKPSSSSAARRQSSPKTKLATATASMAMKICKTFVQPFTSKEKTASQTPSSIASHASNYYVKKIISQIKTTATTKSKQATKDTMAYSKSKLLDTRGDISSKLAFKNT